MKSFLSILALGASIVAAAPQPQPDVAAILEGRQMNSLGICSFNSAATAMAQKKNCTTIILNGINVPAMTTLDMTGLKAGTKVCLSSDKMITSTAMSPQLLHYLDHLNNIFDSLSLSAIPLSAMRLGLDLSSPFPVRTLQ